jgi:hypothetical protein
MGRVEDFDADEAAVFPIEREAELEGRCRQITLIGGRRQQPVPDLLARSSTATPARHATSVRQNDPGTDAAPAAFISASGDR